MRKRLIFFAPLALLGLALFIFVGGEIVTLLWNWLLPPLFGWREITFWQGLALLALCRILFGGFRMHGGGSKMEMRRRLTDRVADRVADRWERMTPEEREAFRKRIRERLGFDPTARETPTGGQ